MFVKFDEMIPPPEPWQPRPPAPRLGKRAERAIVGIVAFNLVMLLLGPLAGASVIEAVVALVRG